MTVNANTMNSRVFLTIIRKDAVSKPNMALGVMTPNDSGRLHDSERSLDDESLKRATKKKDKNNKKESSNTTANPQTLSCSTMVTDDLSVTKKRRKKKNNHDRDSSSKSGTRDLSDKKKRGGRKSRRTSISSCNVDISEIDTWGVDALADKTEHTSNTKTNHSRLDIDESFHTYDDWYGDDLGADTEHTSNRKERTIDTEHTNSRRERTIETEHTSIRRERTIANDTEDNGTVDNETVGNETQESRFEDLLSKWRTREDEQIQRDKEVEGSKKSYLSEDEDDGCFEGVMTHWKNRDKKNRGTEKKDPEITFDDNASDVSTLGWGYDSDSRFDFGHDARYDAAMKMSPVAKRKMLGDGETKSRTGKTKPDNLRRKSLRRASMPSIASGEMFDTNEFFDDDGTESLKSKKSKKKKTKKKQETSETEFGTESLKDASETRSLKSRSKSRPKLKKGKSKRRMGPAMTRRASMPSLFTGVSSEPDAIVEINDNESLRSATVSLRSEKLKKKKSKKKLKLDDSEAELDTRSLVDANDTASLRSAKLKKKKSKKRLKLDDSEAELDTSSLVDANDTASLRSAKLKKKKSKKRLDASVSELDSSLVLDASETKFLISDTASLRSAKLKKKKSKKRLDTSETELEKKKRREEKLKKKKSKKKLDASESKLESSEASLDPNAILDATETTFVSIEDSPKTPNSDDEGSKVYLPGWLSPKQEGHKAPTCPTSVTSSVKKEIRELPSMLLSPAEAAADSPISTEEDCYEELDLNDVPEEEIPYIPNLNVNPSTPLAQTRAVNTSHASTDPRPDPPEL